MRRKGIPEAKFNDYLDNYDHIGNLQLLEGLLNEEKSNKDFKQWLIETYPENIKRQEYMEKNYIPSSISFDFSNFKKFFEERNILIVKKLKEVLIS